VYAELFDDATDARLDQLYRYLDKDGTGCIDMLSWSRRVHLQACAPPLHNPTSASSSHTAAELAH
jgi:hypothetical protein